MPFPSGVEEVIAGTNVTVTGTSAKPIINASGGGGGYASLTGAGQGSSPGDLTQLGGFTITDVGTTGLAVTTAGPVTISSSNASGITIRATAGNIELSLEDGTANTYAELSNAGFVVNSNGLINLSVYRVDVGLVTANAQGVGHVQTGQQYADTTYFPPVPSSTTFPVVVVTGTNDTITLTRVQTGTPEDFTVAAGSYADFSTLEAAVNAATGSVSGEPLSTYYELDDDGVQVLFSSNALSPACQVGDQFTTGGNTLLPDLHYTGTTDAIAQCDFVEFFAGASPAGAQQQPAPSSAQDIADALAAYGLLAGAGSIPDAPPGVPIVRAFPFAYNDVGLDTGLALYTPTVGDLLIDAWIEIDTAWDGTTPFGDYGYAPSGAGFLVDFATAQDMTQADQTLGGGANWQYGASGGAPSLSELMTTYAVMALLEASALSFPFVFKTPPLTSTRVPFKFTNTTPISVFVSQTGAPGGGDPVSTQGSAILYLVTATPA